MTTWREIAGHPGYLVSDSGQVKSLERIVHCNRGVRTVKGGLLTPWECKRNGYMQVAISRKHFSVHRLVALAFCDGHAEGLQVNHKNGNKKDNRAENLEWCTPSHNILHAFRVLHPECRPSRGKFSADHPTSKAVIATSIATGTETRYECALDAVRLGLGFDSGSISRCCYGLISYHKGHYWRFADKKESPTSIGRAAA